MSEALMQALVSIVIPVYNRQNCIRDCLQSCVEQTHRPLEIILVDDGSVDDSRTVIHQFIQEFKSTPGVSFKYFNQINRGAPAARNLGIANAQGIFLTFVDSDDSMLNTAIADRIKFFTDEVDVVFGDVFKVNKDMNTTHLGSYMGFNDSEPISWVAGRSIVMGCLLFRKECFNEINFDESIQVSQDRELCVHLLVNGFRFKHIPIVVYRQQVGGLDRISSIGWTEKNPYRYIHSYNTIVRYVEKCDAEIVRKSRYGISKSLWRSGKELLYRDKREAAFYYFRHAMEINGGRVPRSGFYRFFATIISVNNVELLKFFYLKLKSALRTTLKKVFH